jgi:N-acetylneuraminate synthase
MSKINIIAEIGINHNGDINIAKKLISLSSIAGVDYIKFQKREPDICVPDKQKNIIRKTPWGEMTYLEYKHKVEFDLNQYYELKSYAENYGLKIFASVWDTVSAEKMMKISNVVKVPSALITDIELLRFCRKHYETMIISTGMSTESEIEEAIRIGDPDVVMHCNASYPANVDELNLSYICWLRDKYPCKQIGYSGHEFGLVTTFSTVPLGVKWIERHITLERTMWGSDHMASVEPTGLIKGIH